MIRLIGAVVAVVATLAVDVPRAAPPVAAQETAQDAARDVRALLAAARGAPRPLCALAARSVHNFGWGDRADAPATPLGDDRFALGSDAGRLAPAEVETLLAGLGSDDGCVRELSARLLGAQRGDVAVAPLVQRLAAAEPALRAASAFALGLALA
ncbi:hypothetical protein PYV61_25285, partial [Roseisolibacter sp. H3M3-2]